jgi:hypothetical protein
LLQAHLVEVRFDSLDEKAYYQVTLALTHYLAGDTAGAKVTAEPARNTLEQLYGDQRNNDFRTYFVQQLSQAYAAIGKKDSALEAAERAIMLLPRAKDLMEGPQFEENLALIQTIFGENNRAIATLTQLLQTPYYSSLYGPASITSALLRLDPLWDPLRSDPAFKSSARKSRNEFHQRITRITPIAKGRTRPQAIYFQQKIRKKTKSVFGWNRNAFFAGFVCFCWSECSYL